MSSASAFKSYIYTGIVFFPHVHVFRWENTIKFCEYIHVTLPRSRFSDVTQRSLGKRCIRHPIKRPWRGLVIYGELCEWSNLKKERLKWLITTCLVDVTAMTAIHQHFLFQQTTLPTATFEWLLQEFISFHCNYFPRHLDTNASLDWIIYSFICFVNTLEKLVFVIQAEKMFSNWKKSHVNIFRGYGQYILLDILVCTIVVDFHELCRILTSP